MMSVLGTWAVAGLVLASTGRPARDGAPGARHGASAAVASPDAPLLTSSIPGTAAPSDRTGTRPNRLRAKPKSLPDVREDNRRSVLHNLKTDSLATAAELVCLLQVTGRAWAPAFGADRPGTRISPRSSASAGTPTRTARRPSNLPAALPPTPGGHSPVRRTSRFSTATAHACASNPSSPRRWASSMPGSDRPVSEGPGCEPAPHSGAPTPDAFPAPGHPHGFR